uniref:Probable multidrug resistance protein NorM n=1 Tax=uncultured Bacillota bacterium TaxID=344338 RepID=A0A650EMI6_9FIRM|nr:MATE family efflux transporter [uncultured Firmicutes bacterium]
MNTKQDLTTGNISKKLWVFAIPLMIGNLMQQLYNLADTWIVGRYIGDDALAAVGSSYSLMTFITSVILGLCLGSGAFFSIEFGRKDIGRLKNGLFISFVLIGIFSIFLTGLALWFKDGIMTLLQIPDELKEMMGEYLYYIFMGIVATFLYNYFSNLLRGIGNSIVPLIFLCVSVILNIGLDLYFVVGLDMGIRGAAIATVVSQYISGIGVMIYFYIHYPELHVKKADAILNKRTVLDMASLSGLTCLQQSVMNLGILMVQGIVNGFGAQVMAAFAVAVKIDTIAYMPVQDFGNAFSTFTAQNFGAGKYDRIRDGIKEALKSVVIFCIVISGLVCIFAKPLMLAFVDATSTEIVKTGVEYLRIEGAFYLGIGLLFMLYGYYRAINKPKVSVVLTVVSLGLRVVLAYLLSSIDAVGVTGVWIAIPIGWIAADIVGICFYSKYRFLK